MAKHLAFNQTYGGSIPSGPTNLEIVVKRIFLLLFVVILTGCVIQDGLDRQAEVRKKIIENYTATYVPIADNAYALTYESHEYIVVYRSPSRGSGVAIIHSESCSGRHE